MDWLFEVFGLVAIGGAEVLAQSSQQETSESAAARPATAQSGRRGGRGQRVAVASEQSNLLRGAYGPYRENNDLVYYHLDVRVDPEKKTIAGKNTIRFKMLRDGTRIQIDLRDILRVDKILLGTTELKYERQADSVFIDFPQTLKNGETYSIEFHYSGSPTPIGRFGGFVFEQDPAGRPWIFTACEDEGACMLVALQRPVEGRSREYGYQRLGTERTDRRLQRPLCGQDGPGRRLHPLGLARVVSH